MVKIRLRRVGAIHKPAYRVVVADSRSPRDGRFIEVIGHYDPLANPAHVDINEEKALNWLTQGAQATDTVRSLLGQLGILEKFEQKKKALS
ncbi:MAG: 30S ribosomal protein S16 [Chloroflexota bacterium]|nr:30S ribosomal protein S16 [Chloroflexota bacterium]